jgi:hypothetical protein
MAAPIPSRIVPSVEPAEMSPAEVAREFRRLVDEGMQIRPAGSARKDPGVLLSRGYTPKHKVELFDTTYYLTDARQNEDIRFFVAYVVQATPGRAKRRAWPRIFYKDLSLIWRSASHFIRSEGENWVGKGDLRVVVQDGEDMECSAEETTDLPFEIQTALETILRRAGRVRTDNVALGLVLRRGPDDRLDPYRDFTEPRRRAQADPRNLINGGRPIAWFTRHEDPGSLRFAPGFEPDFGRGVLEVSTSKSKLYGGELRRFRIVSRNRKVQYLFMAGPNQVWIIPPQATTTEIMSYGVRTVDVVTDEDLCIPGYEYHFLDDDEDPPVMFSQIPEGYAGETSEVDRYRADASPWLDELPVIREFRRKILGANAARSRSARRARRPRAS